MNVKKVIQIGSAVVAGVMTIASEIENMKMKETVKILCKEVAELKKR